MALVVLLRGINVGGHRKFRPTLLAHALRAYEAVNIGAAGTLVIRKPPPRPLLRAKLRAMLPEGTQFVLCEGSALLRLEADAPFDGARPDPGIIQFVSFMADARRRKHSLPLTIPAGDDWFVRVTALTSRLAAGEYRRHMKSIGYLGQLDTLFGTAATTRSWGTVEAVLRALKSQNVIRDRR